MQGKNWRGRGQFIGQHVVRARYRDTLASQQLPRKKSYSEADSNNKQGQRDLMAGRCGWGHGWLLETEGEFEEGESGEQCPCVSVAFRLCLFLQCWAWWVLKVFDCPRWTYLPTAGRYCVMDIPYGF